MLLNNINVSVIICCYNSANRIQPTLEHVANQMFDGLACEVVLINNNCTDNTVDVAQTVWSECRNPFPLRVVEEPQPGLSYARMAGVMAAKGEFVIFCDDDNWLEANYFRIAFKIMKEDETIGVLGGRGIVVSDVKIPEWFESVKLNYAVGNQAQYSGDITNRGYVWGSGMVLRKSVLIDILKSGVKSYLSDRNGNDLSSGGDSEISMWFLFWGYKLWYSNELVYQHFIPENRLSEDYYKNLKIGLDSSTNVLSNYNSILHYKNGKRRFKNSISNSIFTLLQTVFYKLIKRDKILSKFTFNIFLLHIYNFVPSNSLLAIIAKDILPKSGFRYPTKKLFF